MDGGKRESMKEILWLGRGGQGALLPGRRRDPRPGGDLPLARPGRAGAGRPRKPLPGRGRGQLL